MATFHAQFTESSNFEAQFAETAESNATFGEVQYIERSDWYEGEYIFTPSDMVQTIEIAHKKAIENITINPIPSNYGLVTWNGSVITVS